MVCRLCGRDPGISAHVVTAKTGRKSGSTLLGTEQVGAYEWKENYRVYYDDVRMHTVTLCHRCCTTKPRLLLLWLVGPMALMVLFIFSMLVLGKAERLPFSLFLTFVGIVAAQFIVVFPLCVRWMPWTKLRGLFLDERGGPPFVVFEMTADGKDWASRLKDR